MSEKSLKERTAGGMLWGGMSGVAMQAMGAVFGLVLLRYITPDDQGKVAMLYIFSALASALQESGFIAALCNRREPAHDEYNAVFWFNLLVSVTLYVILWFCAPLIAAFYGDPDLIPLARVLFLGFLLSGLGTVQRAWLFGHLMVRQTSICSLTAMFVSGIVGITMAMKGFAYWAIVSQAVCFVFVTQLMAWHFSPWRPTLPKSLAPAWRMFGFSGMLMLTNIVGILNLHAFSVLLGKFFKAHTAGVYATARKWDDMASSTINGMVAGVAQPTLSQVAGDIGRYRQVFRKMLRFVCFVSFPAMLGLGLVAQEFILLAGGEKWRESGFILSLLCIHGAFVPVTTLYSNLTISRGRSDVNMGCTICQCAAVWTGLILLYPYGMLPMVVFFIALNVAWLAVWQWWARRLAGLRFRDALMDVVPFLAFTLAVLALTWWITRSIESLWLLLISRILIAAALYLGLVWLSGARIMREAVQYLFRKNASPREGSEGTIYFYHTQDVERIVRESRQGTFPSHFLYGAVQLQDMGFEMVWHHQRHTYRRLHDTIVATWKVLTCRRPYDILYATHTYGIEPVVLLHALGLYRHRIVAWHHLPIVRAKNPLREALARLFYRGLDHMIFFSDKLVHDSLLSSKADPRRMSVVHWGADLGYYNSLLASPKKENWFISTGKELRDYETLAEAFRETGLPLMLFAEKSRQAYFEGLHLSKNIDLRFGERLMPHEIAQLVAASRCVCICCQASNYTVGLTTVVEALALGLPILCTRNLQMPMDIETEGCGFWLDVGDVEGWKSRLKYIYSHPEEAEEMGRRGRALAEQCYNVNRCAEEVAAIISS